MKAFSISLDESGEVRSELARALSGRKITIQPSDNKTHPIRALARSTRDTSQNLEKLISLLKSPEPEEATNSYSSNLAFAFKTVIYSAAEYFEVFQVSLLKSLPALKEKSGRDGLKRFEKHLKEHRRDWAIICNALKHEHNQIVPIKYHFHSTGQLVRGFSLFQPIGVDASKVNRNLHHKPESSRSYGVCIRRLLYSMISVDIEAAHLVNGISQGEELDPLQEFDVKFGLNNIIREIQYVWPTLFHGEPGVFPDVSVEGDKAHFRVRREDSPPGRATVTSMFSGDGMTRSMEIV